MANKIRAFPEGNLAIAILIHTANLAKGTLVKVSADNTVDKSVTEDDVLIGSVEVPAKTADETGTIRTRFRARATMRCSGAIAAGDRVKAGTADSGVQTFKKWISGTDNPSLIVGVCMTGAADDAEGDFLIF